jgi:hypothetical protein
VHGALALYLLTKAPAKNLPLPETVVIALDVAEVPEALPPMSPVPAGTPSRAEPLPAVAASRAKSLTVHGDAVRGTTGAEAVPAPESPTAALAHDTASGATANRWATFQPAHPDLNGPMKFPVPGDSPRDPLAPPVAKGRTPFNELPKMIQGGAGITASVAEDGRIQFHDPKGVALDSSPFQAVGSGVGVGVSGRFDVTDQVMKLAGQDPYASVKRKMAEETREQRLCMARRYQGERQKQELFTLSTKVRRIANRTDLSAAQRRNLVFAIWDECLEDSDSPTDYGAMARATILSVVRDVFPAGSEVAYQPAELLVINERRSSRQPFAPYDPSPMRRARHPDAGAPTECP